MDNYLKLLINDLHALSLGTNMKKRMAHTLLVLDETLLLLVAGLQGKSNSHDYPKLSTPNQTNRQYRRMRVALDRSVHRAHLRWRNRRPPTP